MLKPTLDTGFLPDLCAVQAVLVIVLVAELLVCAYVLSLSGVRHFNWELLSLVSLFVQWTALCSAAGLCLLRARLSWLPVPWAATVSYGWILLVTALASTTQQWITRLPYQGIDPWQVLRDVLIAAVIGGITLRYFYLQQQLRRQQQAELQARIQALQARIRPHFLFNSMNTVAALIESDPARAEQVVEDMAALFRASLTDAAAELTLAEELDLCRRYARIEQLRLGERLRLHWSVDALPRDLPFPALALQPLIENAIYHGIQPRPQGGDVTVEGAIRDGRLVLTVTNPLPEESVNGPAHPTARTESSGNRIAVDNIRDRLRALYGDSAELSLQQRQGQYTATLSYPLPGGFAPGNAARE